MHAMAFRSPPELILRTKRTMSHGRLTKSDVAAEASTYLAAVCTELGKSLQIQRLTSQAQLTDNQVRVAIQRCALNFADVLQIHGQYQERSEPPFVPGTEFAGIVTEVGPSVTRFKAGDHVVKSVSQKIGLALAQQVVMPELMLSKLPMAVSFEVGASLIFAYVTGIMALEDKGNIKEGDIVLVSAAAGGTGIAAVDLAANVYKAKVIGCAGGAEKCALLKQYGAYGTVDYTKESIPEKVKQITNGRKVDIVYELCGGKVFTDCLKCCGFGSRMLVIGIASGELPKIPANRLLVKTVSIHGFFATNYYVHRPAYYQRSIERVLDYCRLGRVRPHLHNEMYSLSQVNEAIACMESRKSTGKIVVDLTL